MPTFSIIIPTYNASPFIAETIESVRHQDIDDWQIVVIDDGSTDDTVDIVEQLRDPRIQLHRQANTGPPIARQNGFQHAAGDWIIFLDHDDRITETTFQRYTSAIAENRDVSAVYGDRVFIDANGHRYGSPSPALASSRPQGDVLLRALTSQFITTVGQTCINARALKAVGGFPTARGFGADWALWCLLATVGPFLYLDSGPVLEYRRHARNMGSVAIDGNDTTANIEDLKPSMDFVFDHERILSRFTEQQLRRYRQKREANCYRFKGVVGLRAKAWSYARKYFWEACKRDPVHAANIAGLAFSVVPFLRPLSARYLG